MCRTPVLCIVHVDRVCDAVIGGAREWEGGSGGYPIINPLPVSPTVQMVPAAHMAPNPAIGILLPKSYPLPFTPPAPSLHLTMLWWKYDICLVIV